MAKVRDRTEDFKDAARRTALNLGYDEFKIAAIMASFIMHKSWERSSFTKAVLKTLESIVVLEEFLMKHAKDYVDMHRTTKQERDSIEHKLESIVAIKEFLMKHMKDYVDMHCTTEQERDSIEHEVSVFIEVCKDQIDVLKNSINAEEANAKGWLGMRNGDLNADTIAHKHGVVRFLTLTMLYFAWFVAADFVYMYGPLVGLLV